MIRAIGQLLLWILGVIVAMFVVCVVTFFLIFGAAAIWIIRIVLITLIAKWLWEKIFD